MQHEQIQEDVSTGTSSLQENKCDEELERKSKYKLLEIYQSEVCKWIIELQSMENMSIGILQNLKSKQRMFGSHYKQIKQVLISKKEVIRKELNFYNREFQKKKICKIYDPCFQKTLSDDLIHYDSFRQELEELGQQIDKGEIQQQFIEFINKLWYNEHLNAKKIETSHTECDQILDIPEYKELQQQEFDLTYQIQMKGGVQSLAISRDWRYIIVSQAENQMVLWDLQCNIKVFEYNHQEIISATTFSSDGLLIYFGDQSGQVGCFVISSNLNWQKQIHKEEVYQVSEKQKNQIITCSQDNKIILTDTSNQQTIWEINYICPCFSGFDISQNNKLIVAPNYKAFSIWNANNGNEITKFEYYNKEDLLIQSLFSTDMKQLLVGFGKYQKILIFSIGYPDIHLQLQKEIIFTNSIQNISWCFNDQMILVNCSGLIQFRRVDDAKLVKYYFIYEPWYSLQKQDPKGEKIIFSRDFNVFICQRQQAEIDQ